VAKHACIDIGALVGKIKPKKGPTTSVVGAKESVNKVNYIKMKRAVITGIGAVTPLGNSVEEYWNGLINGRSGAAPITLFDNTYHKTKFACEVKGFDPLQYIEKQEARKMDRYVHLAIAAAEQCIADSKLNLDTCNLNRIGVILATGIGGIQTFEEEVLRYAENVQNPKFSPFFITKMISNIAAGQLSIRYGFRGISYAITSACAASNNAIANALDVIRLGRADAVLVGGSEASITPTAIGGFNSMKALSTRNDDPTAASRPFDATRDGFVAGEGAGLILVEEMDHAIKRGAKIYCELAGYGAASDAYHVAATHPDGVGAILAMEGALQDAGVDARDVTYINAHATSTPVGDISECKAIEHVFGSSLELLNVGATKSMTGHLLGAAGAIESIACILAIRDGIIPPTINFSQLDESISTKINITANRAVKREVNVALNNTFGFGGHTSSTVFKRFI
jgi:3-oxoacyl-[acyl-carrier-protein] synthase II